MLEWIGVIAQIVGVFGLSTRHLVPVEAFSLMLVGSTIMILKAAQIRSWGTFTLAVAFTISNVTGIYQWYNA